VKIPGSGHFLGLAFGDRSIRAAEVARDGTVLREAEYAIPEGASLAAPEALGAGLVEFLRANRFTASRAVAGLPARWILARDVEIPPMSAAMAGGALRMQAERDFSMEIEDLVLDYAGDVDAAQPRRILMVALLNRHLDGVVRACRSAGIRLLAATSTALALARAGSKDPVDSVLVSLSEGAAEVLIDGGGSPRTLRHIAFDGAPGAGPAALAAVGSEIRRTLALMPGGPPPGGLVLWDGLGIDPEGLRLLAERAGLPIRTGDPEGIGLSSGLETGDPPRQVAAATLALAGTRKDLLAIDFLHSRCAPPRKRRIGRRALLGAAAAITVAIVGVSFLLHLQGREAELAALKGRISGMEAEIKEAEAFVKNNKSLVLGWYDARPHPLDILKRVTLAFPEEGSIWAVNFSALEGLKGSLTGKAVTQKTILDVLDRMKEDPTLSEVMLADMREAGGGSKVVSFTLTFNYRAPEAAP